MKHLDYLEKKDSEKKQQKSEAKRRKRRLTDRQKVDKHVKGYLNGKFDLQELFTKVEQIGNKSITQDLPEILRKANEKFQLKKH